jgi:hypothetical protein
MCHTMVPLYVREYLGIKKSNVKSGNKITFTSAQEDQSKDFLTTRNSYPFFLAEFSFLISPFQLPRNFATGVRDAMKESVSEGIELYRTNYHHWLFKTDYDKDTVTERVGV